MWGPWRADSRLLRKAAAGLFEQPASSGPTINHKGERMGTQKKAKSKAVKRTRPASRIVWFEIPADDPERARKFYSSLFGWNIKLFPGMADYWHIDTGVVTTRPMEGSWCANIRSNPLPTTYPCPRWMLLRRRSKNSGASPQVQDGRAADGLFRHLSGHGRQRVRALGNERAGEVEEPMEMDS